MHFPLPLVNDFRIHSGDQLMIGAFTTVHTPEMKRGAVFGYLWLSFSKSLCIEGIFSTRMYSAPGLGAEPTLPATFLLILALMAFGYFSSLVFITSENIFLQVFTNNLNTKTCV